MRSELRSHKCVIFDLEQNIVEWILHIFTFLFQMPTRMFTIFYANPYFQSALAFFSDVIYSHVIHIVQYMCNLY